MRLLVALLIWLLRATLVSRGALALENLALRQQLATYARSRKRPRLEPDDRALWVALSRFWQGWRSLLAFVKPATVFDWHRRRFRRYWRWRSRKPGRPCIPAEHIGLIRRISSDQPGWGEDRIADVPAARCRHPSTMRAAVPAAPSMRPKHGPKGRAQALAIKLGIRHSTSTIRRYMARGREPRGGQTWKTFVSNHASQMFACDFLTQPTAMFTIVYIFIVMEIASRRILLINATTSPGLAWVKQQIRQATAWGKSPRFLIHDNDGTFGQFRERKRRSEKGRRYRCRLDLWLADVMGIEGIPIPYGAPNASPHVERLNRTLREEALNQFIFLNVKHVRRVCAEYRDFHNGGRPSQALHAIPDPYPELKKSRPATGKVVALPVLGGVQRDYRRAA
jgi:putative transposase